MEDTGDPSESSKDLIMGVRERLGPLVQDVPGPLLVLPFDALAVAVARDVAADVEQSGALDGADTHPAQVANYLAFLRVVRESMFERRLQYAMNKLTAIQSIDALRQLFDDYAELRTARARDMAIRALAEASEGAERHIYQSRLRLLESAATGEFETAYASYQEAMFEFSRDYFTPRLGRLFDALEELEQRRDWPAALTVAQELLKIRAPGAEHIEVPASIRAANALFQIGGPGRAQRLERAASLLRRVQDIYKRRPDLTSAVASSILLQNLAAVIGERADGDPIANIERALALLRDSLKLINVEDDGRAWAMAHTNLGLCLINRAHTRHVPQFAWGGRGGNEEDERLGSDEIEEAIDHFGAALTWRSFERDPHDWAYTQVNLGVAYSRRLAGVREENLRLALRHYSEAIRGFAAAGDDEHHAQASQNIANANLQIALLPSMSVTRRTESLQAAVEHAKASLSMRTLEQDPVGAGRAWRVLADILVAAGDREAATSAYLNALKGVTAQTEPRETRDASRSLAVLAEQSADWNLAAQAWELAAEAAAGGWRSRVTAEGRRAELDENVNVFRLAAYALAKAGRLERAVEVLEMGRAREITLHVATRLVDVESLRLLDPGLERRFAQASEAVAALERQERAGVEVGASSAADIREDFAETVEFIRALPGFTAFLRNATFADLASAVLPGHSLAYLLSTPSGSMALILMPMPNGVQVISIEVPSLSSAELIKLFVHMDPDTQAVTGYMTVHRDEAGLSAAISAFSSNIGTLLLRPLAQTALGGGSRTLCLIPIGLLGILPLHAIEWSDHGAQECLLDRLTVVFSPSAALLGVAFTRLAQRPGVRRALVVGNPLPQTSPLPGADAEARVVAASVPADRVDLMVGIEATKARVLTALPGSEYVHLACHGSASVFGQAMDAALYLAKDTPLFAREILELNDFKPRLVVASACETAVLQGYESADEVLSLGSMFLASGAAGVVATLWSVDDFATALIMSRFYEGLAEKRSEGPAAVLRAAQMWLRLLTLDDEEAYLATHPILRAQGGRRGNSTHGDHFPYSSVTMWGAFVYTGA